MPGAAADLPTWARELAGSVYLLFPLLGGALLHGACMKYGWLAALKRPIDAGARWRGRPLFGANKTWRGPATVAVGAGAFLALQAHLLHRVEALAAVELFDLSRVPATLLGAAAGAAAELAELPNSFVKRQLEIAPGGTARGLFAAAFYLWDQLDLLLGYWLVLAWVVEPTLLRVGITIGVVLALHPLTTLAGYWLGLRPTAR